MSQIVVVNYSSEFGYGNSNPASIPLKQYIQNGATAVRGGMPMKPRYADNTATFSQGRREFFKTPTCSIYLQDNKSLQCNTGVIRVESTNYVDRKTNCGEVYKVGPQIENGANTPQNNIEVGQWSRSNHTIHNRVRNQVTCSGSARNTCLLNGKQNNIMSAQELISRRKNKTIGKASSGLRCISDTETSKCPNGENYYELSFSANNLNGSHTNYLAVSDAKRRTRNGGYVVPPKCRGHGSGPNGPFGVLKNQGTGFDNSPGINPVPPNMCGNPGWPVSSLLGSRGSQSRNTIRLKNTDRGVVNIS